MRIAIAGFLVLMISCASVEAANIAQCGASRGWGYYPKGILVRGADADNWHQDGISNGRIVLARSRDGSYDLLYGDTLSPINSASKDGAAVVKVGQSVTALTIVVNYPNKSVETYSFFRRPDGVNEVLWTAVKYGTLIPNAKAFRAACDFVQLE